MMKPLNETSLIICGIVRDAESGLRHNIPVIDTLCRQVNDYHIYIYENDSHDRTKVLLSRWRQSAPANIHISLNDTDASPTTPGVGEVTGDPTNSRRRIAKMAALRNRYMEYIDSQDWKADYIVVVDMDVAQLFIDGIVGTLLSDIAWDAVTANGYSMTRPFIRRYDDTYALTLWGDGSPQTKAKMKKAGYALGRLKASDPWMRIASGFGGLAIYRYEAMKGLRYYADDNADPVVEVKCEHYSIYRQMTARGYDKFYLNPAMKLKYRSLSLRMVCDSIKRRVNKILK